VEVDLVAAVEDVERHHPERDPGVRRGGDMRGSGEADERRRQQQQGREDGGTPHGRAIVVVFARREQARFGQRSVNAPAAAAVAA
jgi:hypothetical protein